MDKLKNLEVQFSALEKNAWDSLEMPIIIKELTFFCASELGRFFLSRINFAKDLEEAKFWQIETSDALRILEERGLPSLSGATNVQPFLARLKLQDTLSCDNLFSLLKNLQTVSSLFNYIHSKNITDVVYKGELPEANRPTLQLFLDLQPINDLEKLLKKCILSPYEVSSEASSTLFSIREEIRRLENGIKNKLEQLLKKHENILQESVISQRNDRYVLLVKENFRSQLAGIVHDVSATGQTLFIEPLESVEIHNKIMGLRIEEQKEIERILKSLSEKCSLYIEVFKKNQKLLTRIDWNMAKAKLAKKMKAQACELNVEGRLLINKGRHPLIDAKKVVPISLHLGRDFTTLLITGPNTGGKTLALKLCGVIVFMAKLGLLLPLEASSEINLYSKVLLTMGDGQSIENELSTFSSHIKGLIAINEELDSNTLILADELGSGTDPVEGASLAIAILEKWRKAGASILATSHYRELKEYACLTEEVENASCRFDQETMQPLYELDIGQMGISYAFDISSRLGLDADIIELAKNYLSSTDRRLEELLKVLYKQQEEARKLLKEANFLKEEMQKKEKEILRMEEELKEKKLTLAQNTRTEIRDKYQAKLEEIDVFLAELKQIKVDVNRSKLKEFFNLDGERVKHLFNKQDGKRLALKTTLTELESEITQETFKQLKNEILKEEKENEALKAIDKLIVGETYWSTFFKDFVRLQNLPNAKNQCRILLLSTGMTWNIDVSTLYKKEQREDEDKLGKKKTLTAKSSFYGNLKKKRGGVSTLSSNNSNDNTSFLELKLLGEVVDTALLKIDLHLDQLIRLGLNHARIVHGKGTGKLRQEIHQFLRSDKRVKSFSLAPYGQGDSGVTLVELKV